MDPNNNPTPTNEPVPTPENPVPNIAAVPGQVAEGAAAAGASMVNNAVNNAAAGVAAGAAAGAAGVAGVASAPVNPIINPTSPGTDPLVANQAAATGSLAATDPIMMREPAKAPDPVEEELKAPMKAAEPVPGSIGSAVSGPSEGMSQATETSATNPFSTPEAQTPSVSFNDPATQPDGVAPGGMGVSSGIKKPSKKTLIALIAAAGLIVLALATILIVQLVNNNSSPAQSGANDPTVISPDDADDADSGPVASNTLSCTRNMTAAEVSQHNDVASGTITIGAIFGSDNILSNIAVVESVIFNDEDATNNEPVENVVHESKAEDITSASALNYFLPIDDSGAPNLTRDAIQSNYASLDFVCEAL